MDPLTDFLFCQQWIREQEDAMPREYMLTLAEVREMMDRVERDTGVRPDVAILGPKVPRTARKAALRVFNPGAE